MLGLGAVGAGAEAELQAAHLEGGDLGGGAIEEAEAHLVEVGPSGEVARVGAELERGQRAPLQPEGTPSGGLTPLADRHRGGGRAEQPAQQRRGAGELDDQRGAVHVDGPHRRQQVGVRPALEAAQRGGHVGRREGPARGDGTGAQGEAPGATVGGDLRREDEVGPRPAVGSEQEERIIEESAELQLRFARGARRVQRDRKIGERGRHRAAVGGRQVGACRRREQRNGRGEEQQHEARPPHWITMSRSWLRWRIAATSFSLPLPSRSP